MHPVLPHALTFNYPIHFFNFPRYELGGTPLPFASDRIFNELFPAPPAPPLPVTKAVFTVVHPQKRAYTTSVIPPCPMCKTERVFECQLMPNLINVLKHRDDRKVMTDEERRQVVEQELKGQHPDGRLGMEWGTCFIYSCKNDCCPEGEDGQPQDCWREEHVLVQWEN